MLQNYQTASEAVTTHTQNSSIELEHTHMSDTAATTALPGQEQGYECCECFGTFEEDISLGNNAEWARCACERWIHVDCISKTATDENGMERICSNCVI